jgi:adenylate kinase family enzyme
MPSAKRRPIEWPARSGRLSTLPGSTFPHRRVNVVGASSAGKTTFARELAARLAVPHVELDALHWEPNWAEAAAQVMRERTAAAVAGDGWVVDGNYSVVRELVWARAQAVVWLDYPLRTVLWRFAIRTRRRISSRDELWPGTGNREQLGRNLIGRDSLLWWILSTYRRRRRQLAAQLAAHPELVAIRFGSPAQAASWLGGVERVAEP